MSSATQPTSTGPPVAATSTATRLLTSTEPTMAPISTLRTAPASGEPPRHGPVPVPRGIAVAVIWPVPVHGRRDRVEKVHDYAAFGVRWYWIIDPAVEALESLKLGSDQRYAHAVAAAEGCVPIPDCGE